MRRKKKKNTETDSGSNLGKRLGEVLTTVLKYGGSIEIKVKKMKDDPYNEEESPVPDWLK